MSNEAFAGLVDAHYGSLYRFALSLARNAADAGDLVQQTFFIWATKGHGLHDPAAAKGWLFTTLYREFLRVRRRGSRSSSLEAMAETQPELAAEEVDRAALCDSATVVAALQNVDEVFRAPLTLFYLEDLSYHEIASILEVPIGTVMSRLSRGKAQLRTLVTGAATAASTARIIPFDSAKGAQQA
jgi:RNA polymerase sigma-70 factor (ECF subfamily)